MFPSVSEDAGWSLVFIAMFFEVYGDKHLVEFPGPPCILPGQIPLPPKFLHTREFPLQTQTGLSGGSPKEMDPVLFPSFPYSFGISQQPQFTQVCCLWRIHYLPQVLQSLPSKVFHIRWLPPFQSLLLTNPVPPPVSTWNTTLSLEQKWNWIECPCQSCASVFVMYFNILIDLFENLPILSVLASSDHPSFSAIYQSYAQ